MLDLITRITTSRPKRVLAVMAIVFVAGGVFGGPVAGLLNADNDSFSDTGSESSAAVEMIEEASGLAATPAVTVLVDADDLATQAEVRRILSDNHAVGQVVGGAEAGGPFVSTDGTLTLLSATYRHGADADEATEELRAALAEVDDILIGGQGVAFQEVNETVESDIIRAELLAFPLLLVVALLVFRSAVSALLPLMVGAITIVTSLLVLRGVNEVLEISVFALNLVTGLGLGLAIDYSLFLVSRFREELEASGDRFEAVRKTIATAGRTVTFSAITVAGAGLALLVFPLRFLYSMGIGVVIVALVSMFVSLLLLPALFMALGPKINAGSFGRWRAAIAADARADAEGFWYRLSKFVMRRPVAIALTGVVVLLAMGAPFLHVKLTGVDATVLPASAESKQVFLTMRSDFPAATAAPFVFAVEAPESAAAEVQDYATRVAEVPGVENATPPQYVGDGLWALFADPVNEPLAPESIEAVDQLRALAAPGEVHIGGIAADHVDQRSALFDGIPAGIAILAVLTFLALFLMTGSVILPIKALIMNVMTISATFGILVFIFQDGRLEGLLNYTSQGALESTQPIFLFAVVFGLSTDYAVFLLTRIKEARDAGAGERESVALGLQRTGRIVTAAAVLFAIALGAFATSDIIFIKELGIGVAVAVLIDATIVRALLVPSLMALLGRWNWWSPKPLRKLHDRVGLSEG